MISTEKASNFIPLTPVQRAAPLILCLATVLYVASSAWVYRVDDQEPGTYGGRHTDVLIDIFQILMLAPSLAFFAYAHRRTGAADPSPIAPRLSWTIAFFAFALLMSTILMRAGFYIGDEAAYLFQARTMAMGQLTNEAPPIDKLAVPDYPEVFRMNNMVIHEGRWFGKYPPGWPAVLMTGTLLHIEPVMAPLAGVLMTLVTYGIAALLFGKAVARLAAVFVAICPLAFYNSSGYLSHVPSAALVAGATYAFSRARLSGSVRWYTAMGGLIGFGLLVRPWTALLTGTVLILASFVTLREIRKIVFTLFPAGVLVLTAVGLFLLYNRAMTGDYLVTGYKLYSQYTGWPSDLDFTPGALAGKGFTIARWSLQAIMFNGFPLVFLLAAAAVFLERTRRFEIAVLGALFLVIAIGHMGAAGPSDSRFGERYWFDVYFNVAILGARGAGLILERLRPDRRAIAVLTAVVAIASATQVVRYGVLAVRWPQPFTRIMSAAAGMKDAVVFMPEGRVYTARDFGGNVPRWREQSIFYMPDPGASRRAVVAAAMHKKSWAVMLYDNRIDRVEVLASGDAAILKPAGPGSRIPTRE